MLITVLGPLDAIVEGASIDVTGRVKRGVLATLALRANEPVPVAELVSRVWERDPPASALSTIRSVGGELRAQCGDRPGTRVTVAEAYLQLTAAPQTVDLLVSRRLAEVARTAAHDGRPGHAADLLRCALDLWHGHPLDGQGQTAADPAWPEAAELIEEHWTLLEDRLDADRAAGRYDAVIDELQRLVAAEPLRERLAGILMQALLATGRPRAAQSVYDQVSEVLGERWGIDPGPQLRALRQLAAAPPVRAGGATVSEASVLPEASVLAVQLPLPAEVGADPQAAARLLDRWGIRLARQLERSAGRVAAVLGTTVVAVFNHDPSGTRAIGTAAAIRNAVVGRDAPGRPRTAVATGAVRATADPRSGAPYVLTGEPVDRCRAVLAAVQQDEIVLVDGVVDGATPPLASRPRPTCSPAN